MRGFADGDLTKGQKVYDLKYQAKPQIDMKYINFIKRPKTGLQFIVSESKPPLPANRKSSAGRRASSQNQLLEVDLFSSTSKIEDEPPKHQRTKPRLVDSATVDSEYSGGAKADARRSGKLAHSREYRTVPAEKCKPKSSTRQTTSPPRNLLYKSRFNSSDKVSKSEGKRRVAKKSAKVPSLWSEHSSQNWMGGCAGNGQSSSCCRRSSARG